jgi:transcriptional regulator with XRE-family HTH domain
VNLKKHVLAKIEEIGQKEAAKLFGVSIGTISNWSSGRSSPSIEALQLVLSEGETESLCSSSPTDTDGLTQWEGKNVILLLPVYRSFSADTHFTLFANYAKYGAEKLGMIQEKRTLIHESRNILVNKFLKTKAEYAIMIDDDMILPCGNEVLFNGRYGAGVPAASANLNAISRLMSHSADKQIVGALYFGRHERGQAQCEKGMGNAAESKKLRMGEYSGLIKDGWVGTGCMRIHRSVFEAMAKEIDNGRWPELAPVENDGWYGFFTPLKVRVGEDVSFCRRASEIGIQSYLDTSLVCLHTGESFYGPRNTK